MENGWKVDNKSLIIIYYYNKNLNYYGRELLNNNTTITYTFILTRQHLLVLNTAADNDD